MNGIASVLGGLSVSGIRNGYLLKHYVTETAGWMPRTLLPRKSRT